MERIKPRTLSGFMELSPARQVLFDRMADTLRRTYSLYGFTALDTPLIESSEILLAKGGGDTEKQIYRFTKGDSDLSLRFDLTVPLAKYVAMRAGELTFPFRRFQIGKVYRGERAQRGRFREFYQADIDIIGDGTLDVMNEAEIPSVIYRAFTALGLDGFTIRVNNRKLLNGFFEILGISDGGDVMRTIDKLDKIGSEKTSELLVSDCGLSAEQAAKLMAFIGASGDKGSVLASLAALRGQSETFDTGADELETLITHMADFGVPDDHFAIDLTIARGLDYYTGTVYETTMNAHPEIGSICSGGRYDDLAGYYTDRKLPGVGISIGLTRLFYVLDEQGLLNDEVSPAPADVLIIPMTDDLTFALRAATALRGEGIRTQLYTEKKKMKARMSYADKLRIPFVVFVGEDEISSGRLTVKDMASGEQTALTPDDASEYFKNALAAAAGARCIKEK